jgi:imidazolonepropionase-like amidohydrolase
MALGEPTRRDPRDILRPLNTFLEEARRYRAVRRAEGNGRPPYSSDPKFEAMLAVLDGSVPLFVRADREREIREAVAWAKKEGLSLVIVGGLEADKAADLLAKENVPVILGPVLSLPPRFDAPYDHAYTLPARLAKAGVRFCLSTGDASNVRRLPYHAAMAHSYGLSHDEALKAITLYPAQILGMGERLGTLEPGKEANFLLTTGDPLEIVTEVKAAYIAGELVDLSNKHQRLYEKYKARPLPSKR